MRTYLLLKERAAAFRADPEVRAALAASGAEGLAAPTLAPGETYRDLPNPDDVDVEALRRIEVFPQE
jgi:xylose isomerase